MSLLVLSTAVAVNRRYPLVALVLVVVPTLADGNFVFAIGLSGSRSAAG